MSIYGLSLTPGTRESTIVPRVSPNHLKCFAKRSGHQTQPGGAKTHDEHWYGDEKF